MNFESVQPPTLPYVYLNWPWWSHISNLFARDGLCLKQVGDPNNYLLRFEGESKNAVIKLETNKGSISHYKIVTAAGTIEQGLTSTVYRWPNSKGHFAVAQIDQSNKSSYPAFIALDLEEEDSLYIVSAEGEDEYIQRWCVVIRRDGPRWIQGGKPSDAAEMAFNRHLIFNAGLKEHKAKIEALMKKHPPVQNEQ